jgi:hypothetical protein
VTRPVTIRLRIGMLASLMALVALRPVRLEAAEPTMGDVEKLIQRGTELRKQGRDQQALPLFQQAYEIAATPRTAAQLGLCESQLGYYLAAEGHLIEALAGRNEWIEKYRTVLKTSLGKVQKEIGEVMVTGSPPDAEVFVNGKRAGRLPLKPARVVAGQVRVELRAPGYRDRTETVVVAGESRASVVVKLEPTSAAEGPVPMPTQSAVAIPPDHKPDETTSASESSSGRIIGLTLIGVGVAAIGVGATLLLMDKHQSCEMPAPDVMCVERRQTRVPGWSLIGAGAAVGVLGGILVYSFSGKTTQTAVAVTPSSVVVSGRF